MVAYGTVLITQLANQYVGLKTRERFSRPQVHRFLVPRSTYIVHLLYQITFGLRGKVRRVLSFIFNLIHNNQENQKEDP